MSHCGWHSRGYLPHFDQPGLLQFITFRLADSLPIEAIQRMRNDAAINQDLQRMRQIELTLDNLYGACHLRQPEIAALVQQALLHFDGERYRQIAWVIMPNHVHTIIETFQGYPLGQVVHSWKSYTALAANRLLRRTGMFWNIEYFDRVIRDEAHLNNAIAYIHNNPVKAHLVQQASDWPYSSAQWYVS